MVENGGLLVFLGFECGVEEHLLRILRGTDDIAEGKVVVLEEFQVGGLANGLQQSLAERLAMLVEHLDVVHLVGECTIINERARGTVEAKAVGAREIVDGGGAELLCVGTSFLGCLVLDALLACRQREGSKGDDDDFFHKMA